MQRLCCQNSQMTFSEIEIVLSTAVSKVKNVLSSSTPMILCLNSNKKHGAHHVTNRIAFIQTVHVQQTYLILKKKNK